MQQDGGLGDLRRRLRRDAAGCRRSGRRARPALDPGQRGLHAACPSSPAVLPLKLRDRATRHTRNTPGRNARSVRRLARSGPRMLTRYRRSLTGFSSSCVKPSRWRVSCSGVEQLASLDAQGVGDLVEHVGSWLAWMIVDLDRHTAPLAVLGDDLDPEDSPMPDGLARIAGYACDRCEELSSVWSAARHVPRCPRRGMDIAISRRRRARSRRSSSASSRRNRDASRLASCSSPSVRFCCSSMKPQRS